MGIDDFLKNAPPLSTEEILRLINGFEGTLAIWVEAWGERNGIPSEKRVGAFLTAIDLGYRIAKRDFETDKWNNLLSS